MRAGQALFGGQGEQVRCLRRIALDANAEIEQCPQIALTHGVAGVCGAAVKDDGFVHVLFHTLPVFIAYAQITQRRRIVHLGGLMEQL